MNNFNKYLPIGQTIPIVSQTPERLNNPRPTVHFPITPFLVALSQSVLLPHSALMPMITPSNSTIQRSAQMSAQISTQMSTQMSGQRVSFRVLQLTDTHLFAQPQETLLGLPTQTCLQRIIDRILKQPQLPDLIVLTGDLSQDGRAESYAHLSALLEPLGLPIYWLPGNHDCVDTMTRSLQAPIFTSDKLFHHQGWQFILLNSQIPGDVPGRLSAEILDTLTYQLETGPKEPTVLALHHPPVTLQSAWLDSSALENPDELFAVLDRFSHVKLVLFGHIHQEISVVRQGVTYLSCPSTCIQFDRHSDTFALDVDHNPGFRELELWSDGTWASQVHRVDVELKPDLSSIGY